MSDPKHGYVSNSGTHRWCGFCKDWFLMLDNPECKHFDPTDQARQAVVEAAVAYERRVNNPDRRPLVPCDEGWAVINAVLRLQSLTTPEGKRPAKVLRPGREFEFAEGSRNREAWEGRRCITCWDMRTARLAFRVMTDNYVEPFFESDLVIPIEDS